MPTRLSSPTLIGRRSELAQLQAAAQRAADGLPALVLIAGEAGVGKTRLVEELAAWAKQRGYRVLIGGCVSLSAETAPFAPIIEALRPIPRELAPVEMKAVLGPRAGELAALMPEAESTTNLVSATGVSPDGSQGRRLELLLGMLGRLAARAPLVLIVEDIHWGDRSTVDLLAFLARNVRTEPIFLVTTFRTDEPQTRRQLLPLLAELERHGRTERIDLARLNRAEVADQLSAILGAPASSVLTDGVFARSQGNAFFSEELLATESTSGEMPQTLRDVLTARIGALGPEAEELVRVASAAGRRFSESLLERIAGLEQGAFRAALREAIAQQILVPDPSEDGAGLGFRHALMQEILYEDLLPSERIRLHAACAQAIEDTGAHLSDAILASELAHHWQAANEPERALRAAVHAGQAAEAAGARKEAAVQFERALALLDEMGALPADLGFDRAELLVRAAANGEHDPGRAVAHVRNAIGLVDDKEDPTRAGLLHATLGRYLWIGGDGAKALAECRRAVELVPAHPPSVARARVAAGLGQILSILEYSEEGVGYCDEAVAMAAQLGERAILSHALTTQGVLTAYLRDPDEGLAQLRSGLAIAKELNSVDDIGRAYYNLVDVLVFAAVRFEEAGDLGSEGIGTVDLPRLSGIIAALVHAITSLARYLGGRWDDAAVALDRARLLPSSGAGEIALGIRAAQLEVGRGELDVARRGINALQARLQDASDIQWIAAIMAADAELAIWEDRPEAALQVIADGLGRLELTAGATISRIGPLLALGVRAAAEVVGRTRRDGAAKVEAARSQGANHAATVRAYREVIARRWPAHLRLAEPFLALCEAEATRLDGASDPEAWARAAERFEERSQPYDAAYARYREGEALVAMRSDAKRMRSALRNAHAISVELGAAPLQKAIEGVAKRARLELAPESDIGESAAGRLGLTAREQEILALVAAGLSNRQIGERLFITEKTASHHVSNILAKLGVSGRAEAAAEAVSLGLTSPPG